MNKRAFIWIVWFMLPITLGIWHFGPGQRLLNRDLAASELTRAKRAVSAEDWQLALASFSAADSQWPEDSIESHRRIALGMANSLINSGDLLGGQAKLEELIAEMESDTELDTAADKSLLAAARHDLATSAYYAAWMMRLEGAETEEWLQEAEVARQQFRLVAETSQDAEQQRTAAENLEATIRLEQMDLRELLARPLPKNCCSNCNSLCQKKRKQAASRCESDGKQPTQKKEERDDARKEIKKLGAGLNSGGQGS